MIAIDVKHLSKIYKLYTSPVDRLKEIIVRKPHHTLFTALQDLTFTARPGETIGIIGENGAGKSTLLKILANTLKPTSGTFTVNGKVAALLELGAGFNPELSGEENIYLNAYLMRLSKREVDAHKTEIIAFSELGDFIARPIKTYSSGMHIRLAFSIAVCVDPDILIIDEVLAVGDQHFQKKCIDKIVEFKKKGKTILFCSHSLYYVQELCDRSLWLKDGIIERIGDTATVINAYLNQIRERHAKTNTLSSLHPGPKSNIPLSKLFWIDHIIVRDRQGRERNCFSTGEDIQIQFSIRSTAGEKTDIGGHIGIGISRNDNIEIFGSDTKREGFEPIVFRNKQDITVTFPAIPLLTGQYLFTISLGDEHALHPYDIQKSEIFQITSSQINWSVLHLEHRWEFNV